MGQTESTNVRQKRDSGNSGKSRDSGGAQKYHEENRYEKLPAANDVNNTTTEDNSRMRSLFAVCKKFPHTSESTFMNPAIEDYIQDLKYNKIEEILQSIKEQKEFQCSNEDLNKAVEYFAKSVGVKDVPDFIARHKKKVSDNTDKLGYFREVGMSEDEAFSSAFSLSFYTGLDNVVKHAQAIESRLGEESEGHYAVVNHSILKAINTLPYYWGACIRTLQMDPNDQKFYQEGSIISWNIMSSATKGNKPAKAFRDRNTYFYIWSFTGREISQFSNFPEEDEILFPPWSTFIVVKKTSGFFSDKVCIYLRQVELGLGEKPVLWVDDHVFDDRRENKQFIESVSTKGFGKNAQLIPKMNTESALSFLESKYGQALKNSTELKIITDMARLEEEGGKYAGALFLKKLREKGFKQKVLIYVMNRAVAKAAVKIHCGDSAGDFEICTEWGDSLNYVFSN